MVQNNPKQKVKKLLESSIFLKAGKRAFLLGTLETLSENDAANLLEIFQAEKGMLRDSIGEIATAGDAVRHAKIERFLLDMEGDMETTEAIYRSYFTEQTDNDKS